MIISKSFKVIALILCQLGLGKGLAPRASISNKITSRSTPSKSNAMESVKRQTFQPGTDLHPNYATSTTYLASQSNGNSSLANKNSSSESRKTLSLVAGTSLASIVTLAKFGFLGDYADDLILHDFGVTILTTILSLVFVKSITKVSANGYLEPRDARKIIHTCSAPLFIVLWPLFSHVWGARVFASFIPFIQAIRLWMAGTKTIDDNGMYFPSAIGVPYGILQTHFLSLPNSHTYIQKQNSRMQYLEVAIKKKLWEGHSFTWLFYSLPFYFASAIIFRRLWHCRQWLQEMEWQIFLVVDLEKITNGSFRKANR